MKWLILTGAGNGVVTSHPRPPILSLQGTHSLLVEDSIFVDSTGMMFQSPGVATYTIKRSLVSRVGIGGEFLSSGHTLVIEDSWWTGIGRGPTTPQRYDGDGLHVDGGSSNQTIRRSIIADIGDDAIDHFNSNFFVYDTIIHDVNDKATSLTGGSATFTNSLIFNAPTGIRGTARVYNSTITTGSPIQTPQIVQESIIWPNSIPTCGGDVDYTIVGSAADLGCGNGNQSVNPSFTDTAQCDYRPAAGSPALTAGPTGGRIGWLGFPSATACSVDANCNDNNACTIDSCSAGVCDFRPIAGCRTCTTNADCSDANACTNDTCGALGTCQASTPTSCDDANACTTDSCDAQLGCQHTSASCDDANPCTDDSCSGGSCVHANNTAPCSDGSLCTTGDVCAAGSCSSGAPLSCPGGSTCDPGTGQCVAGPVTVSFRDGVSGYVGTQDTYLTQGAPTTVQGAVNNWRWDTENPAPNAEFGLIRFDGIFGAGAGQIPLGSTIQSATLTLEVTNGSVTPNAAVNESTSDWSETTATWNNFGGDAGVQSDEYLASPQYAAPIATGSVGTAVTASVQAWSSGLRSNFGWVFRPANNDGVQVNSAEFATVAQRPSLTVTYFPPAPTCVTNADCDDGNLCTTDTCVSGTGCVNSNNTLPCGDGLFCNGNEVCGGGSCQPGVPVNCSDGVSCTADSCNEATDACEHTSCSMSATAIGSRWLEATPPAGLATVALKVTGGLACLPKYIDANGALTTSPVFQSSAQWGTVRITGRPIVPLTAYSIQAEVTAGTPIGSAGATTWRWGDANNSGGVDVFDIVCALDGFQSVFTNCTAHGVDQSAGSGVFPVTVDFADVTAVLDAFSGVAYTDATPCNAPLAGEAPPSDEIRKDLDR
jgi:hypothetical protein